MSKELEIVRKLQHCGVEEYRIALEKIEKILFEYEQIKNARPSEALECLDRLKRTLSLANELLKVTDTSAMDKYIDTIEQTLIKAPQQEKVIRLMFEKNVDIWLLKSCLTVEQYNYSITKIDSCDVFNLTKEEFDLLKRYVENGNKKNNVY